MPKVSRETASETITLEGVEVQLETILVVMDNLGPAAGAATSRR